MQVYYNIKSQFRSVLLLIENALKSNIPNCSCHKSVLLTQYFYVSFFKFEMLDLRIMFKRLAEHEIFELNREKAKQNWPKLADTVSNQRPFLPFGEFLIENNLRQEE